MLVSVSNRVARATEFGTGSGQERRARAASSSARSASAVVTGSRHANCSQT
jgi:hypothetical protein